MIRDTVGDDVLTAVGAVIFEVDGTGVGLALGAGETVLAFEGAGVGELTVEFVGTGVVCAKASKKSNIRKITERGMRTNMVPTLLEAN